MSKPDFIARSVLVTGGNRGIGLSIAQRLAEDGHKVAVTHRGSGVPDGLLGVVCDVTDSESIDAAFKEVEAKHGPVEGLVSNAGITDDTLIMRMSEDQFSRVIDANLTGAFRVAKRASRSMLRARYGRFIFIGSVVALAGTPGQANYAASKAGMIGFSKALAQEVATRGITVNCVAPGFIESPMTDALNEQQKAQILSTIPAGRLGSGGDVAAACVYLASNEAGYMTGQTLHVNGGMAMI